MTGSLPLLGPDPNAPKGVHLVGRYALGVEWQDRHSSIYPFEFLREACGCPSCRAARGAGARAGESAWPSEIKREGPGLRVRWADGHETPFEGPALRRLCRCAACTVHDE